MNVYIKSLSLHVSAARCNQVRLSPQRTTNAASIRKDNVVFEPNFSETVDGFVFFSGNSSTFTIETRSDIFNKVMAEALQRKPKQQGCYNASLLLFHLFLFLNAT
jgi:hypothetical protein